MTKATTVVLAAFAISVIAACRERVPATPPSTGEPAREILADNGAPSAASNLIRLEESPSFPVDAQKRPFAMISDSDQRAAVASDKPIVLDEPTVRK